MTISDEKEAEGHGLSTLVGLSSNKHDDEESVASSSFGADNSKEEESTSTDPSEVTKTTSSKTGRAEERQIKGLTKKESRNVKVWRVIVFTMVLVIAAVITTLTYVVLVQDENGAYKESFSQYALTLIEAAEFRSKLYKDTFAAFGDTATASSESKAFPHVEHFEIHAGNVREQTGALSVGFSPFINETTRKSWEPYSVNNQRWIQDSWKVLGGSPVSLKPISTSPYYFDEDGKDVPATGTIVPTWMVSPPPVDSTIINFDLLSNTIYEDLFTALSSSSTAATEGNDHKPLVSRMVDPSFLHLYSENQTLEVPHGVLIQPVFDAFEHNHRKLVAWLNGVFKWENMFSGILDSHVNGIYSVLENSCNQTVTYMHGKGGDVEYLGEGDLSDPSYHSERLGTGLLQFAGTTGGGSSDCMYTLWVSPSDEFRNSYDSNDPIIFTVVVGCVFFGLILTFFVYDVYVQRRNDKITETAIRSNQIVTSMFPTELRQRMFKAEQEQQQNHNGPGGLKGFLDNEAMGDHDNSDIMYASKPIADLFPETTIMFADISGFTAWSSVREPPQVFILLETLYKAYDDIAKRRRVFKVETIGDCYVAVAGLPEPRKDHAIVMARFARSCLSTTRVLTRRLETVLGPDTGDLNVRIGLHSGPVTAGVLRGERSRFQLFGDTMNTASRMESTGSPSRIQVSQVTANELKAHGKEHWVEAREDRVVAKGKGEMKTYWLTLHGNRSDTTSSNGTGFQPSSISDDEADMFNGAECAPTTKVLSSKTIRLNNWMCDVFERLLRHIIARRNAELEGKVPENMHDFEGNLTKGETVLDEVKEIITLPNFNSKAAKNQQDPSNISLGENAILQLKNYVATISMMYHSNPFHNYEHACHVTMSVTKLLARIIAPTDIECTHNNGDDDSNKGKTNKKNAAALHDHTYGITSDPLTQFAVIFSALIHDVDHRGIPNTQLIKENSDIAALYKNKSIAEQNSVDLAWNLLMDPSYSDLRACIYGTESEMKRFRALVVNTVMATDIMDKDLKTLRNSRWEKAFSCSATAKEDSRTDAVNRKATIVIEHIIQASDVSHTMQHWHIYRKWNERLFMEMYKAYQEGKAEKNPAEFWYKGEIGFFDFYIIPLCSKLSECGIFGVSSHECLGYAMKNRDEWELRGQEVVGEMIEKIKSNEEKKQQKQEAREIPDAFTASAAGTAVAAADEDVPAQAVDAVGETSKKSFVGGQILI